jgi:hypothetical protein
VRVKKKMAASPASSLTTSSQIPGATFIGVWKVHAETVPPDGVGLAGMVVRVVPLKATRDSRAKDANALVESWQRRLDLLKT